MELTLYTLGGYCKLLRELDLLAGPLPQLDLDQRINFVSCDSRQAVPGTLFLCKGARFKAEYLAQARERGAIAYLSQRPYPQVDLPCIQVTDMRRTMAPVADFYYNRPSEKLNVIGITGTKGKSSTTYYLKSILDAYLAETGGKESGVVSSIDTYDGVERFESHLTTPEPLELQKHFANAVDAGLSYLTMEASSQALKYHRTLCTRFAAACFLNISPDHISPIEHPDFEDYFASKLKIFAQSAVNCVNLDCDRADEIFAAAKAAGKPVLTFSQKNPRADVYGDGVEKRGNEIFFRARTPGYTRKFRLIMPGLFNVENALAAITVCHALNIPEDCVYAGLSRARVPGRMEVFVSGDGKLTAIVDYAHNRLSFETLFRSVQVEYPGQNIVAVFGCPGGKAYDRRRDLAEIAGKYASRVYLTEEDSGDEDTVAICREIAAHAGGCPCAIQPNRGEAIRRAILDSETPAVLLITGKGAETRQKRGTQYVDCPSDVEYVRAFLREYNLRAQAEEPT